MDAFPAFFPLTGRRVIIAGQGDAAEAKARLFANAPAEVVRVVGDAAFDAQTYAGALLVFVAGDEPGFCEQAATAARKAGALVNVADRPDLCDFLTPAVVDRGEVVAAIGTGGASPILASLLRSDIEARVPEGAGWLAALLRKLQSEVKAAYPDLAQRRAFLRRALSSPAAEAALRGEIEVAEVLMREAIARGETALGRVRFVAAPGPADGLRLRAARALFEADVIVADADVGEDVLALARRDARRLAPAQADPAVLAALVREGQQIVRLITGPATKAELKALAATGAEVEQIPA